VATVTVSSELNLLIADEALAGPSSVEVDEILDILASLNHEGITMIMIGHIMRAVMRFSSRVVVLDAGHTIADGTPEETMRQSAVEKAYLGT
jgi:branched-chain amino acid transport system ATP-binding protein